MENFKQRINEHSEHVRKVGLHCTTEETTKQALILPLLDILGFSPYNPMKVKAEYGADFPGVKVTERVDYALFSAGVPVIFIEAKAYNENLTNHCPQLSRYYNATPDVTVSAITNGREWRFFTDLVNRNIMDDEPFLVINFEKPEDDLAEQLHRFHYDELEPDALRALAEENIYLTSFKEAITSSLRECDIDFVKYVLTRTDIRRQMTARFLESVQPIVRQAVAQSVSTMVASSLYTTPKIEDEIADKVPVIDPDAPVIDPDNPNIVTTAEERRLFEICQEILPDEDLQARDTETYYSILYEGKTNRWLLRFWGDRKRPSMQFIQPLTNAHKDEAERAGLELTARGQIILDKPENLYRVAGLLRDALDYCKDDDNFRRGTRKGNQEEDSEIPPIRAVK